MACHICPLIWSLPEPMVEYLSQQEWFECGCACVVYSNCWRWQEELSAAADFWIVSISHVLCACWLCWGMAPRAHPKKTLESRPTLDYFILNALLHAPHAMELRLHGCNASHVVVLTPGMANKYWECGQRLAWSIGSAILDRLLLFRNCYKSSHVPEEHTATSFAPRVSVLTW